MRGIACAARWRRSATDTEVLAERTAVVAGMPFDDVAFGHASIHPMMMGSAEFMMVPRRFPTLPDLG
ncbi:MAG: hypothetical protein J0I47_07585 [Sphingomonas sp.]|uniref:hypothetical protein n=1 Tax=Sphingomonas sp. TaxID=28214 RepID=UPI001AD3EB25|nr:hypothetical protein [Sphingomonas sp.]MBN8808084.1 hypothetical protein [Sphingomonas sp.]